MGGKLTKLKSQPETGQFLLWIILGMILIAPPSKAVETSTRAGITLGGTALISLSIERHFDHNSIRLNIGIFEPEAICLSMTVNRYFTNDRYKPYIGIGIWKAIIIPEVKFANLNILNVPIGLDYAISKYHHLFIEGDMNLILGGRNPGEPLDLFGHFLPTPGLGWKYRITDG